MSTRKHNDFRVMKKLAAIVIFFSVLNSCNNDKWAEYSEPDFSGNGDKVYLDKGDSVTVNVPEKHFNMFTNCQIFHDSLLYAYSLDDGRRLSLYNMNSGKFMYDITVDKNTSGVVRINNFTVVSEDSIFFSTSPKTGLVLVDSRGRKLDMWTDGDMVISPEMEPSLSERYAFSIASYLENFQYDKGKNLIYSVLSPFSAYDELGDPEVRRHGIYNLSSRKWEKVMAPYEGVLKYKGESNVYFYDMHHPYQIVIDDLMYVTYPVDHRVYTYDMNTGKLLKEKDISPSCATRFDRPLDYSLTNDRELNQLRRSTAYYGPLYYHPDTRCFSRFYNLRQVEGREAERAIVIYDMDFNIVYEKIFKLNEISRIVPADDGIVVICTDPYDADTFALVKYKICWK